MDLSNPTTQAVIGGVIRSLLIAIGGGAIMSGDQLGIVAGALAAVIGVGWSVYQKRHSVSHATMANAVNATAVNPKNASAIIAAAKAGHY